MMTVIDINSARDVGSKPASIQVRDKFSSPARLLRACWTAFSACRARDRDRRALASMSDRELADIGENRASIEYEINRSFWRG
jgi:uncharacterized protein YjiS (DUF1127 family)